MKKWIQTLILFLSGLIFGCAQDPPDTLPAIEDPAFNEKLLSLLSFSAPLMGVDDLNKKMEEENWLLLDAREWEEYEVSHIPGARFSGYNKFSIDEWSDLSKDQPIVVYCSVGYRSEKITQKFEKQGFTRVYNLYGSIFEWVNRGYPLEDIDGQPTQSIHTYNKNWSRWVNNKKAQKVW